MNEELKKRYDVMESRNDGPFHAPEEGFQAGWDSHVSYVAPARVNLKEVLKKLPKDGSIDFAVIYKLKRSIERLGGEADISEFVSAGIQRFLPIRIVMNKDCDKGHCEESFNMAYSPERVRVWWSGKAYSILGEHTLDGIKDAEDQRKTSDMLVFDPLDTLCPVNIDWEQWLFDMHTCNKYGARNAKFSKKVFEREEDDAKFD